MRTVNVAPLPSEEDTIELIAEFKEDEKIVFSVIISKKKNITVGEELECQQWQKKIEKFKTEFEKSGLEKTLQKYYKLDYFEFGKDKSIDIFYVEAVFYFDNFELHCLNDILDKRKKRNWIEIPYHKNPKNNLTEYAIIINTHYPFIMDNPNADLIYEKMKTKSLQDVLKYYARYEYTSTQFKIVSDPKNKNNKKIKYLYNSTEEPELYVEHELYKRISKVGFLDETRLLNQGEIIIPYDLARKLTFQPNHEYFMYTLNQNHEGIIR